MMRGASLPCPCQGSRGRCGERAWDLGSGLGLVAGEEALQHAERAGQGDVAFFHGQS
ncbi:MAG: hypothetical protein RL145_1586 [Pseudomonadota bacterium]|jgi:hypothetical protein